jgi:hypothetical protein
MVTIIRQGGFSVVIYKDDHPPAHVHIIANGRAKIILVGPDGSPELVGAYRLTAGDVRKAMKIVRDQQFLLLQKWKEIHGGAD